MSPWFCLARLQACPGRPTSLAAQSSWLLFSFLSVSVPVAPGRWLYTVPTSTRCKAGKSLGTGQHYYALSWQWPLLPAHPFPDSISSALTSRCGDWSHTVSPERSPHLSPPRIRGLKLQCDPAPGCSLSRGQGTAGRALGKRCGLKQLTCCVFFAQVACL